ncbi:MAG: hypothetical protein QM791_08030 [Ferruginibacter sp.]
MHYLFLFLTTITSLAAGAQQAIDTSSTALFKRLPAVPATIAEAKQMAAAGKNAATALFEKEIKQQIAILYTQSDHKSRILSMLAGKVDEDGRYYDFSKINTAEDPILKTAQEDANTAFFASLDDYQRRINSRLDSVWKMSNPTGQAEQAIKIYREELPVFINIIRQQQVKLQQLIKTKGYAKVLITQDSKHPYYIQLLETRALMLDRLSLLNKQAESVIGMISMFTKN